MFFLFNENNNNINKQKKQTLFVFMVEVKFPMNPKLIEFQQQQK